jgi:hypothetical protein
LEVRILQVITNLDLELAGGLLHDDAATQCFDIRERTIKAGTDNLVTLFSSRKGSVTANSATSHLLRIQAIHQCFHHYVALKDYIWGPVNAMADDASRLFHLTNLELLTHFNSMYPQTQPWNLWIPTSQMHSAVIAALRSKTSKPASFLLAPEPPLPTGNYGKSCHKLAIDPTLQEFQDPVPFLQVFARRYRTGDLAPRKKPVRSHTVEDALSSVGQTFASVGAMDPRITTQGKLDFRLQRQFFCYSKQDPHLIGSNQFHF